MKSCNELFNQYLEYRQAFAVSRDMALSTLAWAEPLAREALGIHAQRDQMDMGERLQYIPVMTTAVDNGGWGELMPVWFKPYERPLPIYILDNWALLALLWQQWLGDVGPAYNVQNLLKIFVGSDLLIPFLPKVERGGHFLRHGAFTILLGILWLDPGDRQEFMTHVAAGANQFTAAYLLRKQDNIEEFMSQIEFEAFFIAEGSKIGGEKKIKSFLDNKSRLETVATLCNALCFSLAALYDWYGSDWQDWIFQKVNLDYRLARFGLEAWARLLIKPAK
jgi:hypothetical protein